MFDLLCKKISSQQGEENTPVYMVGEQLKDICRAGGSEMCEVVLKDLELPEMSLAKCEAQIHAEADKIHKKNGGSCACVSPKIAEDVIKKFYGIDAMADSQTPEKMEPSGGFLNLEDFI